MSFMALNPYLLPTYDQGKIYVAKGNNIAPKGTMLYERIKDEFGSVGQPFDPKEHYIFKSCFVMPDEYLVIPENEWICVHLEFALHAINSPCFLRIIEKNLPHFEGKQCKKSEEEFFKLQNQLLSVRRKQRKKKEIMSEIFCILGQLLGKYVVCMSALGIGKKTKWNDWNLKKNFNPELLLPLVLELILNVGTINLPLSWQNKRKYVLIMYNYVVLLFNVHDEDTLHNGYVQIFNMRKIEDLHSVLLKTDLNITHYRVKVNLASNDTKMCYHIKNLMKKSFSPKVFYIYGDDFLPNDPNKARIVRIHYLIIRLFQTRCAVEELQQIFNVHIDPRIDLSEAQKVHLENFHVKSNIEAYVRYITERRKDSQFYTEMHHTLKHFMNIYKKCTDYFNVPSGFSYIISNLDAVFKCETFHPQLYLCMMLEVFLNIGSNVYLQEDAEKVRFLHTLDPHLKLFSNKKSTDHPTGYKNVLTQSNKFTKINI